MEKSTLLYALSSLCKDKMLSSSELALQLRMTSADADNFVQLLKDNGFIISVDIYGITYYYPTVRAFQWVKFMEE